MGKRDVQIVGSSIAAFHVARFLCDKEYKVNMEGFHPPKFVDRLWLVRDVKNFTYTDNSLLGANHHDFNTVVYFKEETLDDIDGEITKLRRWVKMLEETPNRNNVRFILVSSDLVYGSRSEPVTEGAELKPDTPEGEFYSRMEQVVRESKLNKWVILRPAEIYGEGIYSKIHDFAQNCIEGKDFKVADNKRDFTYIWNLSEVIMRCIQKAANVDREVYNVSNDHPVRYLGLGNTIATMMGKVKTVDKNKHTVLPNCKANIDDSITDMENIVVDITKLKKKLKYDPTYNNHASVIVRRILPFELNYLSELTAEKQLEMIKRL